MTKEKLLGLIATSSSIHGMRCVRLEHLNEFFESNVCIPKGDNCHPYHIELHEWAENPLVDLQAFNDDKGAFTLSIMDEYRIKPSEPVYEWQWYDLNDRKVAYLMDSGNFMTENEAMERVSYCHPPYKFEETKRERK